MTPVCCTCEENTVVIKRLDDEGNVEHERSEREEREAKTHCSSILGIIFTDIMSHLEMNCTCLESLRLRFVTNTRTSQSVPGRLSISWKRSIHDYWIVDLSRALSDSWKCFTRFTEQHSATPLPDNIWPKLWSSSSQDFKSKPHGSGNKHNSVEKHQRNSSRR